MECFGHLLLSSRRHCSCCQPAKMAIFLGHQVGGCDDGLLLHYSLLFFSFGFPSVFTTSVPLSSLLVVPFLGNSQRKNQKLKRKDKAAGKGIKIVDWI
jgi:hypothetical protein